MIELDQELGTGKFTQRKHNRCNAKADHPQAGFRRIKEARHNHNSAKIEDQSGILLQRRHDDASAVAFHDLLLFGSPILLCLLMFKTPCPPEVKSSDRRSLLHQTRIDV